VFFILMVLLVGVVGPATAQNDAVSEVFQDDFGADPEQARFVQDNLQPVDPTDSSIYRFGDNPDGQPTLGPDEAGYVDAEQLGAFLFQWNNEGEVPDFGDVVDPGGDGLGLDVNGGLRPHQSYVVFTAVTSGPIPYGDNDDHRFKNFAFIISMHGREGWVPLSQSRATPGPAQPSSSTWSTGRTRGRPSSMRRRTDP
jgi:hypothetical protein